MRRIEPERDAGIAVRKASDTATSRRIASVGLPVLGHGCPPRQLAAFRAALRAL